MQDISRDISSTLLHLASVLEGELGQFGLELQKPIEVDDDAMIVVVQAADRDELWLRRQVVELLDRLRLADGQLTWTNSVKYQDGSASLLLRPESVQDLQKVFKNGNLEEYTVQLKHSLKRGLIKRRPKRKQHELVDPSKSARAAVNVDPLRNTFKLNARVSSQTIDLVDKIQARHKLTKRQVVEEAVQLLEQRLKENPDHFDI